MMCDHTRGSSTSPPLRLASAAAAIYPNLSSENPSFFGGETDKKASPRGMQRRDDRSRSPRATSGFTRTRSPADDNLVAPVQAGGWVWDTHLQQLVQKDQNTLRNTGGFDAESSDVESSNDGSDVNDTTSFDSDASAHGDAALTESFSPIAHNGVESDGSPTGDRFEHAMSDTDQSYSPDEHYQMSEEHEDIDNDDCFEQNADTGTHVDSEDSVQAAQPSNVMELDTPDYDRKVLEKAKAEAKEAKEKHEHAPLYEAELRAGKGDFSKVFADVFAIYRAQASMLVRDGEDSAHPWNTFLNPVTGTVTLLPDQRGVLGFGNLQRMAEPGAGGDVQDVWYEHRLVTSLIGILAPERRSDTFYCDPEDIEHFMGHGAYEPCRLRVEGFLDHVKQHGWVPMPGARRLKELWNIDPGSKITRVVAPMYSARHFFVAIGKPDLTTPEGEGRRIGAITLIDSFNNTTEDNKKRCILLMRLLNAYKDFQWGQDDWKVELQTTIQQPNLTDCGPMTVYNTRCALANEFPKLPSSAGAADFCRNLRLQLLKEYLAALQAQYDWTLQSSTSVPASQGNTTRSGDPPSQEMDQDGKASETYRRIAQLSDNIAAPVNQDGTTSQASSNASLAQEEGSYDSPNYIVDDTPMLDDNVVQEQDGTDFSSVPQPKEKSNGKRSKSMGSKSKKPEPTIEEKKQQWDNVAHRVRDQAGKVFKLADKENERLQWFPETPRLNLWLGVLLHEYFGGEEPVTHFVTAGDVEKGPSFSIGCEDVLSLQSGQWMTDLAVIAVLTAFYPDKDLVWRGQQVADPRGMNWLYNYGFLLESGQWKKQVGKNDVLPAAPSTADFANQVNTSGLPFNIATDDVMEVYGVVNDQTQHHYFAFRIDKANAKICIIDSWVPQLACDQNRHTLIVETKMRSFIDNMVSLNIASPGWKQTSGRWSFRWEADTYKQRNSDDCGPHAIMNLLSVIQRDEVLKYHNADILRQRFVLRIRDCLNGADGTWGRLDPYDDELHVAWRDAPGQRSRRGKPGDDIRKALEGTEDGQDDDEDGPDFDNINPGKHPATKLSYRQIVIAILRNGPREGMTWDAIFKKYRNFTAHLGLAKPSRAYTNYLRNALNKRKGMIVIEDKETELVRLTDPDQYNLYDSDSAIAWYGSAMEMHIEARPDTQDDIHTRPAFVILPVRYSNARDDTLLADAETEAQATRLDLSAMRTLAVWELVHHGRTQPLAELDNHQDLWEEDPAFFHIYKMLRSSMTPAFQNEAGHKTPQDNRTEELLEELNAAGEEYDCKMAVTWLLCGADAWTTSIESIVAMVEKYSHISFRLTMLMPSKRVEGMPKVFRQRTIKDVKYENFSWAHFDLDIVANIHKQILADPKASIQWQRLDQAALIHMLREVEDWKAEQMGAPVPEYSLVDNSKDTNRNEQFPIGTELVSGLERHSFLPELDGIKKKCYVCDAEQTTNFWRRGSNDQADVICDSCEHEETLEREETADPETEEVFARHMLILNKAPLMRKPPAAYEYLANLILSELRSKKAKKRGKAWGIFGPMRERFPQLARGGSNKNHLYEMHHELKYLGIVPFDKDDKKNNALTKEKLDAARQLGKESWKGGSSTKKTRAQWRKFYPGKCDKSIHGHVWMLKRQAMLMDFRISYENDQRNETNEDNAKSDANGDPEDNPEDDPDSDANNGANRDPDGDAGSRPSCSDE